MQSITGNMEKYENYKEQMGRLNRAVKEHFYLEAIFIEYAIMEDRLESILRHSEKWNPEKRMTINKKCTNVLKLTEEKKGIARKYFSEELINSILLWKDNRNKLMHALLKQSLHTEDLECIASEGQAIVKTLSSKTTSYNRAISKYNHKEQSRP